jgi:hypothetical protein
MPYMMKLIVAPSKISNPRRMIRMQHLLLVSLCRRERRMVKSQRRVLSVIIVIKRGI